MARLTKLDAGVAVKITESRKIAGFRNALIHGYDSIDDAITWGVIISKLPILREELNTLLAGTWPSYFFSKSAGTGAAGGAGAAAAAGGGFFM